MTTPPPAPLEWHPAYRGQTWLIDWLNWLNGTGPWDIRLPVPRVLKVSDFNGCLAAPDLQVRILQKRRCVGLAAYVGTPYVWEWFAGIDDLGRCIAGDSHPVYMPWSWDHAHP